VNTLALDWIPQQYAATIFLLKGGLALVATLLYLAHMVRAWDHLASTGQRWRYMVLLYMSVLITGSSVEQVQDGQYIAWRHIGALIGCCLLIIAAVASLREDRMR
jgi:hypothetical protein